MSPQILEKSENYSIITVLFFANENISGRLDEQRDFEIVLTEIFWVDPVIDLREYDIVKPWLGDCECEVLLFLLLAGEFFRGVNILIVVIAHGDSPNRISKKEEGQQLTRNSYRSH